MRHLSREAGGIGARISALEVDLVGTHAVELQESGGIELDAAVRAHVPLGPPALDAVRIELVVPRAIQRVGHVDALAVTADLDHLRGAVQRLLRTRRGRLPANHPPPTPGYASS